MAQRMIRATFRTRSGASQHVAYRKERGLDRVVTKDIPQEEYQKVKEEMIKQGGYSVVETIGYEGDRPSAAIRSKSKYASEGAVSLRGEFTRYVAEPGEVRPELTRKTPIRGRDVPAGTYTPQRLRELQEQRAEIRTPRGATPPAEGYMTVTRAVPREQPYTFRRETTLQKIQERYQAAERFAREKVTTPITVAARRVGITKEYIGESARLTPYAAPYFDVPARLMKRYAPQMYEKSWVRSVRDYEKESIKEYVTEFQQKPIKQAALFAASFTAPVIGTGAQKFAVATRLTKIPGAAYIPKVLGYGLAGAYALGTGVEFYTAKGAKAKGKVVGRKGAELTTVAAGAYAGQQFWTRAVTYAQTFRKKEIPVEKLAWRGEKGYGFRGKQEATIPLSPKEFSEAQIKKSFYMKTLYPKPSTPGTYPSYAGLPGEKGGVGVYGWTTTPEKWPKTTRIKIGKERYILYRGEAVREAPGAFVSPVLQPYFLRLQTKRYDPFQFGVPTFKRPAAIRIKAYGIESIPQKVISGKGKMRVFEYVTTKARPTKFYAPRMKLEYEAVLPPGTVVTKYGREYFTRIDGVRIPIFQYKVAGLPGEKLPGGVSVEKLYSSYYRSFVSPTPVVTPYQIPPSYVGVPKVPGVQYYGKPSKVLEPKYYAPVSKVTSYTPGYVPSYTPPPYVPPYTPPKYTPTPYTPTYTPPSYAPPSVPPAYRPAVLPASYAAPYAPRRVTPARVQPLVTPVYKDFRKKMFAPKKFKPLGFITFKTKYTPTVLGLETAPLFFGKVPKTSPLVSGLEARPVILPKKRKKKKRRRRK